MNQNETLATIPVRYRNTSATFQFPALSQDVALMQQDIEIRLGYIRNWMQQVEEAAGAPVAELIFPLPNE